MGIKIPNPKKEAEKAIKNIIKPAIEAGKREVYDGSKWARDKVREVQGEAEGAVKKVEKEATDNVRKVGKEIEETFEERIPELVQDAFEALAQAVTKEGLKAVQSVVKTTHTELEKLEKGKPELVGAINDLGGKVEIGPITLAYANFYTRTELVAGVLDTYVNKPPELRRGPIIDMVKALGPDSVDLGISVQVVAVVVGSKELGVGGGLNDVSIELFAEIGDVILENMGVPA